MKYPVPFTNSRLIIISCDFPADSTGRTIRNAPFGCRDLTFACGDDGYKTNTIETS